MRTHTGITQIDVQAKCVITAQGEQIPYRQLLWAADQKALYRSLNLAGLTDKKTLAAINDRQALIEDMKGNDSVFTLYLSVDLDKSYFEKIHSAHFFYTPDRKGQSAAGAVPLNRSKDEIRAWLKQFLTLTTYEISIPVLRDEALAPPGKSGLIISLLFDYSLARTIRRQDWEDAFRALMSETMLRTLNDTIYPGIKDVVIDSFTSTPLTLQQVAGTTQGAITGWAFNNQPHACRTPSGAHRQRGQHAHS